MLARSNNYRFLHMEFAASDTYYMLPQNIVDAIVQFQPNIVERRETIRASDSMLTIILEKRFDIPYVAPLDVATGTRTHLAALAERYWTVFKPEMWEEIRDRILKS